MTCARKAITAEPDIRSLRPIAPGIQDCLAIPDDSLMIARQIRKLKGTLQQRQCRRESFAEHDLEAQPHRADKTGDDNGDHGLESIALGLLDTFAPAP